MRRMSVKEWHIGRAIRGLLLAAVFAVGITGFTAQARTLDVKKPSEEQIRERVAKIDLSEEITYKKSPVVFSDSGDYEPGELSDVTQQNALYVLNAVRYIAGISDNVTLDDAYVGYAQAGALVMAVNGKMEHEPANIFDIPDALFQQGFKGTSEGNLYSSRSTSAPSLKMNAAIVSGWMADNSGSNLETVGHRRWCLNPAMGKTGFGGIVGESSSTKTSYGCMYVYDKSGTETSYETVVWPAQTMPTEYFGDYPWSISSKTGFAKDTQVTLIRNRNGETKKWSFSEELADGNFAISNAGYGMYGCIIFRPQDVGAYQDGDVFTVNVIEGGKNVLSYTVNFFSLVKTSENAKIALWYNVRGAKEGESVSNTIEITDNTVTSDKISVSVEDATVVEVSLVNRTLWLKGLKRGKTKVTVSLPNGSSASCDVTVTPDTHEHSFSLSRVVREATCYLGGLKSDKMCECGASMPASACTIIPMTEHTEEIDAAIPATCTAPGKTQGKHCSVCNEILVKQEEIKALGHTEEIDAAIPATCTAPGKTQGSHCKVCKTVLKQQVSTEPLGHQVVVTEESPATCAKEGWTAGKYCSRCNESLEGREKIEKLPHTIVVDERVEPTCTDPGKTEGSHCSVCNEVLVEQEAIEATGHTEVKDAAVPATYESTGLTEGSHCSVCGEILVAQKITPRLTHSVSEPSVPSSKPTLPVPPTVGSILRDEKGGGTYKVTETGVSGTAAVEYQAPTDKNVQTVDIPNTVIIGDVTYKVTSIAPKSFKNNRKLQKVTIGANIEKIGKQAFSGCKQLKSIKIRTTKLTAKNVGKSAFKGIYKKAVIKVPKKSLKAYKKLLKKKGVGTKAKIKK